MNIYILYSTNRRITKKRQSANDKERTDIHVTGYHTGCYYSISMRTKRVAFMYRAYFRMLQEKLVRESETYAGPLIENSLLEAAFSGDNRTGHKYFSGFFHFRNTVLSGRIYF